MSESRSGLWCIDAVAEHLSTMEAKKPREIATATGWHIVTVRNCLARLVAQNRAKRLGKPGQHTAYLAVSERRR